MTNYQKEAIKVLMNLYNDHHIDEEQYFLFLDFIIDNKRHFNGLTEEQWEDYFKNKETPSSTDKISVIPCNGSICTNPFHDCVNCPRQFGGGNYTITTNKVEEHK